MHSDIVEQFSRGDQLFFVIIEKFYGIKKFMSILDHASCLKISDEPIFTMDVFHYCLMKYITFNQMKYITFNQCTSSFD